MRVPFTAYRLLHDLLIEEGVFDYTKKQKKDLGDHLFAERAVSPFQMGALSWRFATVLSRPREGSP